MSLINDALRDLEDRKANDGENKAELNVASSIQRSDKQNPSSFSSILFGGLVVGAVLVVGGYSALSLINAPQKALIEKEGLSHQGGGEIQQASERSSALKDSKISSLNGALDSEVRSPVSENVESPLIFTSQLAVMQVEPEVHNSEYPLALWLEKAKTLLVKNQLSVPDKNNALYFVGKILEVSPGHAGALEIKSDINARYRALLNAAISENDADKVSRYLDRYNQFDVTPSEYDFYIKSLEGMQLAIVEESNQNIQLNSDGAETEEGLSHISSGEAATEKVESNPKGQAWVSESDQSKIVSLLKNAKASIGSFEEAKAISDLEAVVAFKAGNNGAENSVNTSQRVEAMIFLVDYYASARNANALQNIINVTSPASAISSYAQAKQALLVSDILGAYNILNSKEVLHHFEAYDALLAALHHKMNNFSEARDLYRKLLVNNIRNPQYLLGYALALDALEDFDRAYSAYQDLVKVKHPNQAVMKYSRERLQSLAQGRSLEASIW